MIPADVDRILARLDTLEDLVRNPQSRDAVVDIDGARKITKHRSDSAFYRWASENDLKPCKPGGWLTSHIQLALTRAVLRKRKEAKK